MALGYNEVNAGLCVPTQDSPLVIAVQNHKYRIRNLREEIVRAQEELRIELARLAAVKKLQKRGK